MHLIVDLRGCHFSQERGIPNYAINLTLEMANRPGVACRWLVHRDLPRLHAEERLRSQGDVIYHEDLDRIGSPHCDVFLMTSVVHGLDVRDHFERYLYPPAIAARKPQLAAIAYDLIPLIFKERYLADRNISRSYHRAINIYRHCDRVLAISESTAQDLARRARVNRGNIRVINAGLERSRWVGGEQARTNEVVYVGGDDYRKNLPGLIDGFARYRSNSGKLKLAIMCSLSDGTRAQLEQLAADRGLTPGEDVTLTGFVSDAEMVRRVAGARASIFPSLYEGLGMPILESYAVSTPVFGSHGSSIGPLVHPSCRFDPTSVEEISAAFETIEGDDSLLAESVRFGRELIRPYSWSGAASVAVEALEQDLDARMAPAVHRRKTVVVGTLAPDASGIATYNSSAFARATDIQFLSSGASVAEFKAKRRLLSPSVDLAPLTNIERLVTPERTKAAVFVLGNSDHNLGALRAAARYRWPGIPRVVYLHDVRCTGLLYAYFKHDVLELTRQMVKAYPELEAGAHNPWSVLSGSALGTRILFSLVGECSVIVNSKRARDLLVDDLAAPGELPDIETLFLPVAPPTSTGRYRPWPESQLVVGHFGHVGPMKRPDLVIKAGRRLIERGIDTRVVFAGRHTGQIGEPPSFVELIEDPSDELLSSVMRGVDVAVQPREPDHGESSGVINQLMAVGKRPVTTAGTAADDLGQGVVLVPRGSDENVWADAILQARADLGGGELDLRHLGIERFGQAFDAAVERLSARPH